MPYLDSKILKLQSVISTFSSLIKATGSIDLRDWASIKPQLGLEQPPRHGDLGHLESDIAAVVDELGADLDQLLLASVRRKLPRL